MFDVDTRICFYCFSFLICVGLFEEFCLHSLLDRAQAQYAPRNVLKSAHRPPMPILPETFRSQEKPYHPRTLSHRREHSPMRGMRQTTI